MADASVQTDAEVREVGIMMDFAHPTLTAASASHGPKPVYNGTCSGQHDV